MYMLLGKTQVKAKKFKDAIASFDLALSLYVSELLLLVYYYCVLITLTLYLICNLLHLIVTQILHFVLLTLNTLQ